MTVACYAGFDDRPKEAGSPFSVNANDQEGA